MESKLWLYAYLALGGAVLFFGGYYLGLSEKSAQRTELQNTVYNNEKKEPEKKAETQIPEALSGNASSTNLQDSIIDELPAPIKVRQQGGIRSILEKFVNETNPVYKYATLAEAMQQLNPDNLEETLEVFDSISFGFENMQEYRMLFYAWSQFDPYGAIDCANQEHPGWEPGLPFQVFWKDGLPATLRSIGWVERPENQGMAKLYNFGLVKGWASTDLEELLICFNMKGGDEVEKLAGTFADFYNKRGFGEASRWAEEMKIQNLGSSFYKTKRTLARDQPERWPVVRQHADKNMPVRPLKT